MTKKSNTSTDAAKKKTSKDTVSKDTKKTRTFSKTPVSKNEKPSKDLKKVIQEKKSKDTKNTKQQKKKEIGKKKGSKNSKSADSKGKSPGEPLWLINKRLFAITFFNPDLDCKLVMKKFFGMPPLKGLVAETMKRHDDKCRYSDILCIDKTRVILKDRPKETDFIHANWMTMPDKFKYISAQGPMDETTEDFWHMIFTEKVPAIVMICDFFEDNYQKCAQYIPEDTTQTIQFGPYKITRTDTPSLVFEDVTQQTLEVSVSDKPTHVVTHFHYRNWRDHSAPMTSASTLKLLKMLREPKFKCGPPVIHCSAGIGRTATFIGVDYGGQRIGQLGEKTDMFEIVNEMRRMRHKAVQSHHQFMFMLVCISDQMVMEGVPRNEDMQDLLGFYKNYMTHQAEKRKEKAEKEKAKKEKAEKAKSAEKDDMKTARDVDVVAEKEELKEKSTQKSTESNSNSNTQTDTTSTTTTTTTTTQTQDTTTTTQENQ
ncbi:unnamed protein product [Caenorhabditis nigoni]